MKKLLYCILYKQYQYAMTTKVSSFGNKKTKIMKLLEKNGFVDIIEKDIRNPRGIVGVSKKYINCKAIILILKSPHETKGREL